MISPLLYKRIKFNCTMAVSLDGTAIVVSELPDEFRHWILWGGEFPKHSNWEGLPTELGCYYCTVQVYFGPNEPDVSVLSFRRTEFVEKVELSIVQYDA